MIFYLQITNILDHTYDLKVESLKEPEEEDDQEDLKLNLLELRLKIK